MIPYSRQSISKQDIAAVVKVLKSDWLTQGPAIAEFEKALATYCGAKYAVAVSNGTTALHLACLALGLKPNQEVITSSNTFAASANCVLYCEAKPVFGDIENAHWNLSPDEIRKRITSKTKGIIPVHFAGHPCEMKKIHQIAKQRQLFVLEDGCHALGASYRIDGRWHKVGSCSHSDAAIFSFHPVKSIATGEGGAILTNRREIYEKLISLRTHGITKNSKAFKIPQRAFWNDAKGKKQTAAWYYEMQDLGFNHRMTDIQCALGISQLKRLDSFIRKRRAIARIYDKAFKNIPGLQLPSEESWARSAWHLYPVQIPVKGKNLRAAIFHELREAGIGVQVHYIPVHYQPYYQEHGYSSCRLPVTEAYYARTISLPVYPDMKPRDIQKVISVFSSILAQHCPL